MYKITKTAIIFSSLAFLLLVGGCSSSTSPWDYTAGYRDSNGDTAGLYGIKD